MSHALFLNHGLLYPYAGSSGQHTTAHDMQNHSQRRRAGRNCEVGRGVRECVSGTRCVYLHISLQHCKTHPDTPHWEDEKSGGRQMKGIEGYIGRGDKQWCTVPKPEWMNATTAKTQERKRESFIILHPCSMHRTWNCKNKNINKLLLLFHCMLFTQSVSVFQKYTAKIHGTKMVQSTFWVHTQTISLSNSGMFRCVQLTCLSKCFLKSLI